MPIPSSAELIDKVGLSAFWSEAHATVSSEIAAAVDSSGLNYNDVVGIVGDTIPSYMSDYRTESQIASMISASLSTVGGLNYNDVVGIVGDTIPSYTSDFVTASDLGSYGYLTSDALSDYRTYTQIEQMISTSTGELPTLADVRSEVSDSLSLYSTASATDSAISNALTDYRTYTQIASMISTSISSFMSSTAVSRAISSALSSVGGGNPLIFKGSASWTAAMSSTVTAIPAGAFAWRTNLSSEMAMTSVKYIGAAAFYSASGLTYAQTPNAEIISDYAFYSCKTLVSTNFYRVHEIGAYAFAYCTSLTSSIGTNTGCPLIIGSSAFYGCTAISSINLSYCHVVEDGAFAACTGINGGVYINLVESIGDYAFGGCTGITAFYGASHIRHIGPNAFRGCTGLTTFTASADLNYIGANAFRGCTNLSKFYFSNCTAIPTLENVNAFQSTKLTLSSGDTGYSAPTWHNIVVPNSLYSDWVTAPNWNYISSRIVPEDQVAVASRWTYPTGNLVVDTLIDKHALLSMMNGTVYEGAYMAAYQTGFGGVNAYTYGWCQCLTENVGSLSRYTHLTNGYAWSSIDSYIELASFTDGKFFTAAHSFIDGLFDYDTPELLVFYASSLYFSTPISMMNRGGVKTSSYITVVFPNLTSISYGWTAAASKLFSSNSLVLSVFVPSAMYDTIVNDVRLGGNIYHCLYSF